MPRALKLQSKVIGRDFAPQPWTDSSKKKSNELKTISPLSNRTSMRRKSKWEYSYQFLYRSIERVSLIAEIGLEKQKKERERKRKEARERIEAVD